MVDTIVGYLFTSPESTLYNCNFLDSPHHACVDDWNVYGQENHAIDYLKGEECNVYLSTP